MNHSSTRPEKLNYWLLFLYMAIVTIGWFSVFATSYKDGAINIFDFSTAYGRQTAWIITSLILGLIIFLLDVRFIPRSAWFLYLFALGMLMLVLVIGVVISGSKGWINLGAGIKLQPAEFAKYTTALFLAKYMSIPGVKFSNAKNRNAMFAIVFIPMLFVFLQHDTGSAIVFVSFIFLFYRAGMPAFYLFLILYVATLFIATLLIKQLALILILVGIFSILIFIYKNYRKKILKFLIMLGASIVFIISVNYIFSNILKPHQKDRINVLIGKEYDPKGSAFNVNQSLIAIGSGGWSGKGFLEGTQTKYNFVPEQTTDFIFCTVGEQWGFLGSSLLIILYVLLLINLVVIAEKQRSDFSRYYIYGVTGIIFMHFFINIGMTLALVPVIGIPLPLVSYGGSSMMAFTLMIFTVLKLDMNRSAVL